ncbi:MAG: Ig-like domain-containing protein, partial [Paludibacteraceae bacterium]|nr:Ig-like domain-containing protein [Paludibacteraceae bacterium]
ALAGFTACDQPEPTPLELTETNVTLKVGETHQLEANVPVESWTSSNEDVATVADGLVTAVSAGNAIISATAAGVTKTCVVLVEAGPTQGGTGAQVKGTKIWPIILDAVTAEANAAKIVGDLRVDDTNNFLYVWPDGTSYNAGEGTGLNFHGNNEGYVALTVANIGWSGCGFCLGEASAAAAEQLRQAIVANPDKYFLHIAMKATTPGNHQFYTFNDAVTSFAVGTATIEAGAVIGDFTRDGSWAEFDVPMANFAAAMANLTFPTGGNIFCALSGNATGSQLNLDAVYFYEK